MDKIFFAAIVLLVLGGGFLVLNKDQSSETVRIDTPTDKIEPVNVPAETATNAPVTDNETKVTDNNSVLDLSNQQLTKLPPNTFFNAAIQELNLANNALTGSLPGEIRFLQNLKVLNMSNNQFTGVPAEIGQLQNLEVLDLSNNKITGLPNELGNLKNLKILKLTGNQYSTADLEGIKKNLSPSVVIEVD